ncbi:S-layer homology domain-containing protein [Mesobacillus stamsii]|uniref:SLH domain-containing protein n=1 Tax=Mesobacillus stamsii TaxID=225347 RepID=A0ABU0FQI4_9BACI|nr:S-layer homology domain-containing protein [Mesobacillus stamsii]MDQ0412168.1 hypothetical protein [Mesobacillus stamsii]
MKKYPFSNKAVKAMLAATIALSPVAATAPLWHSTSVHAEAIDSTSTAIDRIKLIYSHLNYEAGSDNYVIFNKAAEGLKGFTKQDWNDVLSAGVAAHINGRLPINVEANGVLRETVTAEDIAAKLAAFVYTSTGDTIAENYHLFQTSHEGIAFKAVMGSESLDTILEFLVESEKALWDLPADTIGRALLTNSIDSVTRQVRDNVVNSNDKFKQLNQDFRTNLGTDLEGLFEIQERINGKLKSKSILNDTELKSLRDAFILASLAAGDPDPEDQTNPGGGGSTPPLNPPAPGESNNIMLPEQAAEVVKEKNPSGRVEVITKIFAEKVDEIVGLITQEKDTVQVKLEKPAAGEAAKAQIPAGLFTKAALKNGKAVVEVSTDEASYKLPAAQIKIADLASKLGANEQDVQIVIAVNVVNEADVKDSVAKNKLKLASKVIEFTVTAEAGTKTEPVSKFSAYVERDITGEYDFDKENSAAVRLNPDGTISAIPTLFNGKTATVKSLTNSKYTIVENDKTFTDVKSGWAQEYIETLGAKYIIQGKATGEFEPGKHMTRAEFAVLLVRALGLPTEQYDKSFKDVLGIEWFAKKGELTAAVKYGVVQGKLDGTFAPNEKITRAQAAAMVERAMKVSFVEYDFSQLDKTKTLNDFKDAKQVGSWAKSGVEAVYQAGIVKGKGDGTFNPNGYTQRNEMAAILANFLVSAQLLDDTFSK